jgi:hypothetical protein
LLGSVGMLFLIAKTVGFPKGDAELWTGSRNPQE